MMETTFQTELGQLLDTMCDNLEIVDFSLERWTAIVTYKTAFYSCYLSTLTLALALALTLTLTLALALTLTLTLTRYKTAFYSFYLSVAFAMVYAGITNQVHAYDSHTDL
jgi:hypothetical protein